jgi:hypothetical protein
MVLGLTLLLYIANHPALTVTLLTLKPVNANVHSVHLRDGAHVGNLKRIGTVWKFKAVGYDTQGGVVPGGGPLTDRHNTEFAAPDAAEVSAKLGAP